MASVEEICNEALGLLGENPITSIEDREAKAIRCKQFWATTRDACLRAHDWAFAVKRVALQQLASTPAFGYAFAYELPSDCLRLISVTDDETDVDGMAITAARPEFKLEGKRVLSDSAVIFARYVARIEATGLYDSLFTTYLAASMAAKLGAGLTKGNGVVSSMMQLAELRLAAARAADNYEAGTPAIRKRSTWLEAR